jgi:hypothetical protein
LNNEQVPDFPPFTITITWAPGDSVVVDYPRLLPWEAHMLLEQAQVAIEDAEVEEPVEHEADGD